MFKHRKHILGSKRILQGYDDVEKVNKFISGATLTGGVPVTGVLDVNLKPARIELEQLMDFRTSNGTDLCKDCVEWRY